MIGVLMIKIQNIKENNFNIMEIQDFLFDQIKQKYGYGYIKEFHYDIIGLKEYYKDSKRSNLFTALNKENMIVGTIAIREYDKNYKEFQNLYSKNSTASIWRLFVHKDYRNMGIGSQLVKIAEKFIKENNYKEIYLHTDKNINRVLDFWKKLKYQIILDTNNEFKTVHMIKHF
jgi:ribosomal protein S18 acetylase RimI-like enzyme